MNGVSIKPAVVLMKIILPRAMDSAPVKNDPK